MEPGSTGIGAEYTFIDASAPGAGIYSTFFTACMDIVLESVNEPDQQILPFAPCEPDSQLFALDLFCGIGGMSLGFKRAGFKVTGVDNEPIARAVFRRNRIGRFMEKDLSTEQVPKRRYDVVIGGPPCRPWSAVNLQRRGSSHGDHMLLERFFEHIRLLEPAAFLMENVPPILGDPLFEQMRGEMKRLGYSLLSQVLKYSDFGAATARRRLFTVGFKGSEDRTADTFFQQLEMEARKQTPQNVRDAIGWLRNREERSVPDHEWSKLRTIDKYSARYETGQYGWKQLGWSGPAPSFGSVSKTYILHPSAGEGDFAVRVLSVREVLSIMGFPRAFQFPGGTSLSKRYVMVANAVSPIAAEACARVIRSMLTEVSGE